MKMKRLLTGLAIALFLTACADDGDTGTEDSAVESDGGSSLTEEATDMEMDMVESPEDSGRQLIGEKVIRTVSLDYETLDFERTTNHVQETVSNHEAFVEYSYESSYTPSGGASRQYRTVEYTLRVPTENLNTFLNELEGMEAYKTSEQMGTEDVTQTYRDTEARIGVLENKENRLTELLDQAVTIEEIIQIEDSLSETIAEREMLQSQLDNLDDLIDFTVVRLTVTERPRIATERGESVSFFRHIQDAVTDSLYAFYYMLQDVTIFLIYAIPYLVGIGLIGGIVWFITKRIKNRKKT